MTERPIDAELLKRIAERLIKDEQYYGASPESWEKEIENFKTLIDTMPTIDAKPDWISVEDHLPKIDEEVLVQDLFENIFVGKIYDPEKHNGKYGSYFINTQNHSITTGVAWMKKPTPYKDEKEGE